MNEMAIGEVIRRFCALARGVLVDKVWPGFHVAVEVGRRASALL